ncbi:hypothetical protein [Ruania zhangjianzhongii]|nr:hypothetical protein [Ruania zhangjianzhongii]
MMTVASLQRSPCGHRDHATVIDATTGEILTEHTLDPARTYQVKNG